MSTAPPALVTNEARLAALQAYGILDTPPEQGFDDIVQLARQICGAPVALVSLVSGDRQWFKARAGFPHCETGLNASVCAHALAEPDLLVIPNLATDARTRDNPLVIGAPYIQFYAGAPLRTPEGHVLGSLCVIDHRPRPEGLSEARRESLRALARQVVTQLELRRVLTEQRRVLDQRAVLLHTQTAVAEARGALDAIFAALVEGAMTALPHAEGAVIGLREGEDLVSRAARGSVAEHAGLRVPLRGSLAGRCMLSGEPALVPDVLADPRVTQDLAEARRGRSCLVVPVSRGGEAVGALTLQSSRPDAFTQADLTLAQVFAGAVAAGLAEAGEAEARRAASRTEYRRRAVFDSAHDYAIILLDLDGRVTDWNSGASKILGWRPEEMCGEAADRFFTPEDREAGIPGQEMRSALEKGRGIDERWHLRANGERFWALGEMMPLRDEDGVPIGFAKILRDRTEQRAALAAVETSRERYRLAARATNDAIWDWDLATNHVLWNEALHRAYGHASAAVEPTGDWWVAHIHPDDRARVAASIHAVIDGTGTAWSEEYRFRRADDAYAAVLDRGYIIRDADGRAVRMIGAMLDLTERKRAETALRESERRLDLERGLLRAVFDQAPIGVSVAGASPDVPTIINAAAEAMLGHGVDQSGDERYARYGALHPDGRSYEPGDYPTLRALRHGETVRGEPMRYRNARTGEVLHFEVSSGPVRDADGTIRAAATVFVDVSDRLRSEARVNRLVAIVEQSGDFIGIADAQGRGEYINPAGRRLVGLPSETPADAVQVRDFFASQDVAYVEAAIIPRVVAGEAWIGDFNFRHFATGEAVPVHYNQFSLRGPDGAFAGFATVSRDIAERKRTEAALLASEASLRAVLDTVPVGILFAEAPSGRIVGGNRRIEEILRHPILPSPDAESYGAWVAFHADGRQVEPHEYPLARIVRGEEHAELECRYRKGDGTEAWIGVVGAPMRDEGGRLVGAVVSIADIDARKKAEAHQELLNHELSHRMKNLLAMVQAIAAATLRGAVDVEAARDVLGSRLIALGKAHDVLLGGSAERAPLACVVREGVGVQEAAGARVAYEGPEVEIGGKAALSLALTLHELTTNAVKYGALSVPDGQVTVSAALREAEDGTHLRLAWMERGGPPVTPPARKGFGSRLIERGLSAQVGARLVLDYPTEGVTCVVEAPLANFQAAE